MKCIEINVLFDEILKIFTSPFTFRQIYVKIYIFMVFEVKKSKERVTYELCIRGRRASVEYTPET